MQQIINFIIRNKTFLLFLLLFFISLTFTIQTHSYHKSKFINSANFLTGGVYNSVSDINKYFSLKSQNEILLEENSRLKSILYNTKSGDNFNYVDSLTFDQHYKFTTASILKNSYSSSKNVLLLNKGASDSIKQDFGVISSKGIVGIIDTASKHFATILSVLNTTSRISAQLKKTNHFGTLKWDGLSPYVTQLVDIPKIAPVKVGDTIVTSGRSSIFPKGIPIGTIKDFKLDAAENYYEINLNLFNDMTNLEHVYVIENADIKEITNLLNNSNHE